MEKFSTFEAKQEKTLVAIIIDGPSQKKVLKLLKDHKKHHMGGWNVRCEHVTLVFGKPTQEELGWVGKDVEVKIWSVGYSDKAIAAKVIIKPNSVRSNSEFAHITMAFDPETGKGGYESNNITNWIPIHFVNLKGKVEKGHNIIRKTGKTLKV